MWLMGCRIIKYDILQWHRMVVWSFEQLLFETSTMVLHSNIFITIGGKSINGISTGIKYLKIITMLTDGYG